MALTKVFAGMLGGSIPKNALHGAGSAPLTDTEAAAILSYLFYK